MREIEDSALDEVLRVDIDDVMDPTMINEIHDTLRTILSVSGVVSRRIYYEPLGWTDDEVRVLFFQQLRRKLNDVGIGPSPDLEELLEKAQPVLAGG